MNCVDVFCFAVSEGVQDTRLVYEVFDSLVFYVPAKLIVGIINIDDFDSDRRSGGV